MKLTEHYVTPRVVRRPRPIILFIPPVAVNKKKKNTRSFIVITYSIPTCRLKLYL